MEFYFVFILNRSTIFISTKSLLNLNTTVILCGEHIPANFFWDISVRFLSSDRWDFCGQHDHFRRLSKKSELFRGLSTSINASSKIRDREEGIVIYSFFTWFSFLTWVWVNIFLEIVSSKMGTTHIFQPGVRNWPAGETVGRYRNIVKLEDFIVSVYDYCLVNI